MPAAPAADRNAVNDEPLTRRELGDTIAVIPGTRRPRLPPAWLARLGGSVGETIARSLRLSNRKLRGTGRWVPQYQSAGEGWRAAYEWFAGAGRSTETAGIEAERMVACPADEQSFLGRLRELLEGTAGR